MSHIVSDCTQSKLDDGLYQLYFADEMTWRIPASQWTDDLLRCIYSLASVEAAQ